MYLGTLLDPMGCIVHFLNELLHPVVAVCKAPLNPQQNTELLVYWSYQQYVVPFHFSMYLKGFW